MQLAPLLPTLRLAAYAAGLDMRAGFRRTGLGLFWSSLGLVVVTAAFGLFVSAVFRSILPPPEQFLPYLAAGMIAWAFIAGTLHQAAGLVWRYLEIRRHAALPLAAAVLRQLLLQFILLLVNILLAYAIAWGLGLLPAVNLAQLLFGLLLLGANMAWLSFAVALLAARFRDLPQLIAWALHIAFFLSPILWPVGMLGQYSWLTMINPITHMVEMLRQPMLGQPFSDIALLQGLGLLAVGLPLVVHLYRRFTPSLPYWS